MKALILAAGYGQRLRPYTQFLPKPMFPMMGRPMLAIIIEKLAAAGCREIMVNTHHLSHKIEAFIKSASFPIPVHIRYEPEILGTGGAIKNVADFWDNRPFFVINADIVFELDLAAVYAFHLAHAQTVTLVVHDYPEFNHVHVTEEGLVAGFQDQIDLPGAMHAHLLPAKKAFTGIQVIHPSILEDIPEDGFVNSIDVFRRIIQKKKGVRAYFAEKMYWKDIGSKDKYTETVIDKWVPEVIKNLHPLPSGVPSTSFHLAPLKGDGSDRKWFRIHTGATSLILVDHGIGKGEAPHEVDAFIRIGKHLARHHIPVPQLYAAEPFAGIVILEDLGDLHLATVVNGNTRPKEMLSLYQTVIDRLIHMSQAGGHGFKPEYTFQTPEYDRELILERECRYFVDAFLNQYCGISATYADFAPEFELIARKALSYPVLGFMHRDLQSRNIMIKDHRPYFIDFQGGRIGPIQYDLASLLIDPYVNLAEEIKNKLLAYSMEKMIPYLTPPDVSLFQLRFKESYHYCALSRNLQILGAFGFLTRIKHKSHFEAHIPAAMASLERLTRQVADELPRLNAMVMHRLHR